MLWMVDTVDLSHGPWESTHSPVMTCDGIFTIDDGIVHPHSLGYNGSIILSLQSMLLNLSVHHVKILRAFFESQWCRMLSPLLSPSKMKTGNWCNVLVHQLHDILTVSNYGAVKKERSLSAVTAQLMLLAKPC